MAVEGKMARGQRRQREAGLGIAKRGGKRGLHPLGWILRAGRLRKQDEQAFAPAQRRFDGIRQPCADALFDNEPINDGLDAVLASLGRAHRLRAAELDEFAVDAGADKAFAADLFDHVAKLPLLPAHHRRQQDEPGALGQRKDLIDNGLRRLATQRAAGAGIMRLADAGVEQAQVVVDFGGRRDRGARVHRRGALLDGNGGRQTLDKIDFRLAELLDELPRVGREAFHVAPSAFGVERVERQ